MEGMDFVCNEKIETVPLQSSVEKTYNDEMPGRINLMIRLRKADRV